MAGDSALDSAQKDQAAARDRLVACKWVQLPELGAEKKPRVAARDGVPMARLGDHHTESFVGTHCHSSDREPKSGQADQANGSIHKPNGDGYGQQKQVAQAA